MFFRKSSSETKTNIPPYLEERFEKAEKAIKIRDEKMKQIQKVLCRLPFSKDLEVIIYEPPEN